MIFGLSTTIQPHKTVALWQDIPEIAACVASADHLDIHVFAGDVSLRQFLAGMFAYNPWWVRALYAVRWGLVRLLGMKQIGLPEFRPLQVHEIPFTPGEKLAFFELKAAAEDLFYLAGATEKHLTAHLAVVMEPLHDGHNRFYLMTLVHYHHWTGPLYFNLIRTFHHLVVHQMGNRGLKTSPI